MRVCVGVPLKRTQELFVCLLRDSDLVCVFWELGGDFERGKCAAI